ncbi:MAG: cytochrome c biogenesis protein ResB, partial [Actinomycetota bacterium]|nr:cytochrome c biogenesis protein ResB [Actinomycetota bacterium]
RAGAHAGVERAAVGGPGPDPANTARRQVAAERGHVAREGGSLVFHTAFYLLLIGVVVGKLTTFTGQVGVVEGEPGFTDTWVAYWVKDAGRWWGTDDHAGFQLDLDRFDVEWSGAAQPVLFRSDVSIRHADGRTQQRTTVINDPLVVDGMKVHMLDWGYAARVVVRDGDDVAHDGWIHMTAVGGGVWRGAVKAPGVEPQIGLEVHLFPDAPEGPDGRPVPTGWPGARAPLLLYTAWAGDLRFDRVQGVNDLDTTAMRELGVGALRPGFQAELPTGATVAFTDLRRWVGFQVSRRPTDPLLLAAAGFLLVGLIPALYAYRRRVWVEADQIDGTTRIIVAGHALQRPQAFEEEFPAIVAALRRRLEPDAAGRAGLDPDPDASREVVRP